MFLLLAVALVIITFFTWYHFDTQISKPAVDESIVKNLRRETTGPDQYQIGNSWLKKIHTDFGKCTLKALLLNEVW